MLALALGVQAALIVTDLTGGKPLPGSDAAPPPAPEATPTGGLTGRTFGIGLAVVMVLGLALAYKRREASWALLGPIAGVVMCGTLFAASVMSASE